MQNYWSVAWASVAGLGHERQGLVCQDASLFMPLEGAWALGLVSDGAGSARHSDLGSQFLVQSIAQWTWPSAALGEAWPLWIAKQMQPLGQDLQAYAQSLACSVQDLAATLMLVWVHPKQGLYWWQIGDGRAAFSREAGQWQALFTPFRGEEANETIFFGSENAAAYAQSGYEAGPIRAWTLLSDGCERAAFEVTVPLDDTGRLHDPNRPFPPFFEPNLGYLQTLTQTPQSEINALWSQFLRGGNGVLAQEPDDKSMILALAR